MVRQVDIFIPKLKGCPGKTYQAQLILSFDLHDGNLQMAPEEQ